ncbi:MAG: cytochrome P450 [Planktomarina sp.]
MPPIPVKVNLAKDGLGTRAFLKRLRRNLLEVIPQKAVHRTHLSGRRMGLGWHMVMDPKAVQHVLKDNWQNYPKSKATRTVLEAAVGQSLFVAEGAHWRWQRKAASPIFRHRNVQNLGLFMTKAAEHTAQRLENHAGQGVDIFDEMLKATFDVISDVTFSDHASVDRTALHRAIETYIESSAKVSVLDLIGAPKWIPRFSRLLGTDDFAAIKDAADKSVDQRRQNPNRPPIDLLDLFLAGETEAEATAMRTEELRDNLLTFIVAGHVTTALALTWALYLCSLDPNVQDKARAEAQSVLNGQTATAEHYDALPFTRMIIQESLRLYPPVSIISRTAKAADVVAGHKVRKNDLILLPIYAMQRNHLLWDNPDAFDPTRFADPDSIDRHAYLPFGSGPRVCIGAQFAMQEAVIILATLLSKFKFNAIPGKVPNPVMILTLRPEGGMWLKVEKA